MVSALNWSALFYSQHGVSCTRPKDWQKNSIPTQDPPFLWLSRSGKIAVRQCELPSIEFMLDKAGSRQVDDANQERNRREWEIAG